MLRFTQRCPLDPGLQFYRVVAIGYQATGAFAYEIFCIFIAHLSSEDATAHSIWGACVVTNQAIKKIVCYYEKCASTLKHRQQLPLDWSRGIGQCSVFKRSIYYCRYKYFTYLDILFCCLFSFHLDAIINF